MSERHGIYVVSKRFGADVKTWVLHTDQALFSKELDGLQGPYFTCNFCTKKRKSAASLDVSSSVEPLRIPSRTVIICIISSSDSFISAPKSSAVGISEADEVLPLLFYCPRSSLALVVRRQPLTSYSCDDSVNNGLLVLSLERRIFRFHFLLNKNYIKCCLR